MYVIMLHSIGNESSQWNRNWLSVSLEHFETLCKYLVQKNKTTYFLDEWYDYFSSPRKVDPQKLVLTFDDGYLDNWVFAFPILKKYGLRATVFINPEFVDPINVIRPNIEDALSGKIAEKDMQSIGFLSWPEIQAMQQSGVIDIQSHSMSHNTYFKSNHIKDVYNSQQKFEWISWFLHPDLKPLSLSHVGIGLIPLGYPVFEFGRALAIQRYIPDDQFISRAIDCFHSESMVELNHLRVIRDLLKQFPGFYETDEEMKARYRYELHDSKIILEEKLNKKIEYLCWPGGGYNPLSLQLSVDIGYKASTLASIDKSVNNNKTKKNERINRIGMGAFIKSMNGYHYIEDKEHLIKSLNAKTGNQFQQVALKMKREWVKLTANLNIKRANFEI